MDLGFSVDQPSRGRDDRTIGWVQVVLGPAQELLWLSRALDALGAAGSPSNAFNTFRSLGRAGDASHHAPLVNFGHEVSSGPILSAVRCGAVRLGGARLAVKDGRRQSGGRPTGRAAADDQRSEKDRGACGRRGNSARRRRRAEGLGIGSKALRPEQVDSEDRGPVPREDRNWQSVVTGVRS